MLIRNRKYLRHLVSHIVIWTWALIFWNMMRFLGQEVVLDHKEYTLPTLFKLHVSVGAIGGLLFGNLNYFLRTQILRKVAFGRAVFIGSFGYLITAYLLVTCGIFVFAIIQDMELSWYLYQANVFTVEVALLIFYCFQVGFVINFVQEIDKKFGPGNLLKMLMGKFYTPKVDERIFMFLDLKSSTPIAERLGHIQYSKLIQECFKDLDVIKKYQAEVYQYVGDEVVLTWPKEIGLSQNNCLYAYFDFINRLKSKESYYQDHYGVYPQFKAGLNLGKIVIAEVGEIKSEIAFHGDTINTASRIQGECNRLKKDLLVSEVLKDQLPENQSISFEFQDKIQLRGKQKETNVYAVHLNGPTDY